MFNFNKIWLKKCLDLEKLGLIFLANNSKGNFNQLSELVLSQIYNDGCDYCKEDPNTGRKFNFKGLI